jgi:hypothetical protein
MGGVSLSLPLPSPRELAPPSPELSRSYPCLWSKHMGPPDGHTLAHSLCHPPV